MNTDLNIEQPAPSRREAALRFVRDRRADVARLAAGLRDRLDDVDWTAVRYLGGGVVRGAAVLGALGLIVLLITGVVGAVRSIEIAPAAQRLLELPAVRLVIDPITSYIAQHAAGLPYAISPHALAGAWLITCGGLLLLAWSGSRGARIGWVLPGAASIAMAYAGSPALHAPVAAGATTVMWMAGTVLAFTRHRHHRAVHTHTVVLPAQEERDRLVSPRSSTSAAPAPADQHDLIIRCEGRAEQLLFHASLSQTESEKQRWTRASRVVIDLLRLLRGGRYRSSYVHTVLDQLDPERYSPAPEHTDIDAARVYLALAETDR